MRGLAGDGAVVGLATAERPTLR